MNADSSSSSVEPLDLSRWRNVPVILMIVGAVGAGIGTATSPLGTKQFAFSWLLAFMFYLSLCLGGWFLVMVHHLFDASWSVPTRRFCEHLACLAGWPMLVLFAPIAVLAPKLYEWMDKLGHPDHALAAKFPLFTFTSRRRFASESGGFSPTVCAIGRWSRTRQARSFARAGCGFIRPWASCFSP